MIFFTNWFTKITAYIIQLFAFKNKYYYKDKKVQSRRVKGKTIIVCNHFAVWDYPVMMFTFFNRTLRCQIAELMFKKNFIFTAFLKLLGAIKVDRDSHDFSFMNKTKKILDKNGVVLVFPEAKIPKPGEELKLRFTPSFVHSALYSGAKILPVYTSGAYFKKERNRVMIGTPIDARDLYDGSLSESENLAIISEKIKQEIIGLKDELKQKGKKEEKTR